MSYPHGSHMDWIGPFAVSLLVLDMCLPFCALLLVGPKPHVDWRDPYRLLPKVNYNCPCQSNCNGSLHMPWIHRADKTLDELGSRRSDFLYLYPNNANFRHILQRLLLTWADYYIWFIRLGMQGSDKIYLDA